MSDWYIEDLVALKAISKQVSYNKTLINITLLKPLAFIYFLVYN